MSKFIFTESQVKFVIDSVISEQLITREKEDDVALVISTQNPADQKYLSKKTVVGLAANCGRTVDKTGKVRTDVSNEKSFIKNVSDMMGKMDETSKKAFITLSQSSDINLQKFYYYSIGTFLDSLGGNRNVKNKQIVVDNVTTIKNELVKSGETTPSTEVIEPGYSLETPLSQYTGDFFVNNEAQLSQKFVDYVQNNIVDAITKAKEALRESGGTNEGQLIDLIIYSSCSQIPNGFSKVTFPGTKPTFEQLSKARGNAARDYILKVLEKNNIKTTNANIDVKWQGENTEPLGTSGPAWTGKDEDRPKYEQYKYVRVNLNFVIRTDVKAKSTTIPGSKTEDVYQPKTVNDYTIKFTATGRKRLKVNIPSFKFNIPKITLGGGMNATPKSMRCPKM